MTLECSQLAALTLNRSHHMASRVKAFSEKRTNPARPYPDLRTWKAAVFSITVVVKPALHLRLLLLRAGTFSPSRDLPVPTGVGQYAVTPHPLSAHPASGSSTQHAVALPNHKMVFKALSASCVPEVLLHFPQQRPSPVAAHVTTPMSTLTHKESTQHLSHHVSTVFPPHTQEVHWHLPLCG